MATSDWLCDNIITPGRGKSFEKKGTEAAANWDCEDVHLEALLVPELEVQEEELTEKAHQAKHACAVKALGECR